MITVCRCVCSECVHGIYHCYSHFCGLHNCNHLCEFNDNCACSSCYLARCQCPCTPCSSPGNKHCLEHSCNAHICTHPCPNYPGSGCYCRNCLEPRDGCHHEPCKWCAPGYVPEYQDIHTLWDLPRFLDLPSEANHFYSHIYAEVAGKETEVDQRCREYLTARLAGIFSRYLDMVVGGELRHFKGASHCVNPDKCSCPRVCHKPPHDRNEMWLEWYDIRMSRGLEAVEDAITIFKTHQWTYKIGGRRWATIANILYLYLSGKLSASLFVDSVFGLEHNIGSLFGKKISSWNTVGLRWALTRFREFTPTEVTLPCRGQRYTNTPKSPTVLGVSQGRVRPSSFPP